MSKINIGRAVENILPRTNSYTPLVEVIVNAIESIEENQSLGENGGRIKIQVLRSDQSGIDAGLFQVEGFEVTDNGIGFTNLHREAFDTLYTDQKIDKGGRGFGRFVCLKHFEKFKIESIYKSENGEFKSRKFDVGRSNEIIENERITNSQSTHTGTTIRIYGLRGKTSFDSRLETIAKVLVQRILPLLIDEGFECPQIVLAEKDGRVVINLNDYLTFIEEISQVDQNFKLPETVPQEEFTVRTFKIYEPRNETNQISLVAHRREVLETPLKTYIPEFEEAFYEDSDEGRKYIVKSYVFGDYLDQHVSVERGGFRFGQGPELYASIGRKDIEGIVASIAKDAIGGHYQDRKQKKREHVQNYVDDEAPWFKSVLGQSDLVGLRWNADSRQIEKYLQLEKLNQEYEIKEQVNEVISNGSLDTTEYDVSEIVDKVSQKSKDDLIHYTAFRRYILRLLVKSLEKK